MSDTQPLLSAADLEQAECWAEQPHEPVWVKRDPDAWDVTPCPYCLLESARDEHRGCEHSYHRAWRRWTITHLIARWVYTLGITSTGGGFAYSSECDGCMFLLPKLRGQRVYVLGWPTWKWSCVLRSHHWPGEYIGLGSCGKCLPCPTCGSTTADPFGHYACFEAEMTDAGSRQHDTTKPSEM